MKDKQQRAERLRRAREEAGFPTAAAFAADADIPEGTYRSYENGNRVLTEAAARPIGEKLGKPWMWLMYGEEGGGAPGLAERAPALWSPLSPAPANDRRMMGIDEVDATSLELAGANVRQAPIVHRWRMPRSVVEVATDSEGADILILRVKGDSMAPTYTPIDRVMVDTRDTVPSPPGIFVVWDTRSYLVARLQLVPRSTPPRVKISFDNGKYDGYEEVLEGELIKGRVIGKWQWS
jgi:hypothetical protein